MKIFGDIMVSPSHLRTQTERQLMFPTLPTGKEKITSEKKDIITQKFSEQHSLSNIFEGLSLDDKNSKSRNNLNQGSKS